MLFLFSHKENFGSRNNTFFPSYNIYEMVSKIIIQVLLLPPEFCFFLEYVCVCLVIDCDQESLGVLILFSVIL